MGAALAAKKTSRLPAIGVSVCFVTMIASGAVVAESFVPHPTQQRWRLVKSNNWWVNQCPVPVHITVNEAEGSFHVNPPGISGTFRTNGDLMTMCMLNQSKIYRVDRQKQEGHVMRLVSVETGSTYELVSVDLRNG